MEKGSIDGKNTMTTEERNTKAETPAKKVTEDKEANADTDPKQIQIKNEIIECNHLLIGDKTSSDLYVKIKFGGSHGTDLHQTKHLVQT